MRKKIWKESNSALRKVLRSVPTSGSLGNTTPVEYKFGVCYLESNRLHYIYNGMTNNVIATVKVLDDKMVLRYRPRSVYASILDSFKYADKKTINIASNSMGRSRGVIRNRLGEITRGSIMERREERRRERVGEGEPPVLFSYSTWSQEEWPGRIQQTNNPVQTAIDRAYEEYQGSLRRR